MKVFIIADIEGAIGIYKRSQCFFKKPEFQYGRKCLTEDVNAVVKGAVEAGTDNIVIRDTHEMGQNIIKEELRPGVQYIGGHATQPFPILGDPAGSDMVFLVASHAMSGNSEGFFAHTFFGGFSEVRINGNPVGESYIYCAALSELGIPIAFNSGDNHAIRESLSVMPWLKTVEAPKDEEYYTALGAEKRISALREELRLKAFEAVKGIDKTRCLNLQSDPVWEVDIKKTDLAKKINIEGTTLSGATLSWSSETYIKGFSTLFNLVQASFIAYG